jgi:formylmethanofuran dehydrogenase subunit B
MDDVPIRLRPALPSRYRSDEDILRGLAQRVRALRAEAVPA